MQLLVILAATRTCGWLARKVGQPAVMGEITAGILLGPSLLGLIWPDAMAFLFAPETLKPLQLVSQLGLVLFMFVIGMELEISYLQRKTQAAVVISHMSIVFPYVLGVALAAFLYRAYAPPTTSFLAFALFMGIAMSITAFPVLARILQERNITHTSFGAMALTCAAVDDVTAWCLLAAVVAIVKATSLGATLLTLGLSVAFVAVMLRGVRSLLFAWHQRYPVTGTAHVAGALFVMLLAALCTEIIGIHALFGAFLAGVVMPTAPSFRAHLRSRIEDLSLIVLLPLFFAFTGLRTQVGLLNAPGLWGVCALIIAVAVLGKYGGTLFAARATGHSWLDSHRLGFLMNTRGLMELVALNIGYDLGILSPEVFTMLVLMALVTTFMTGPGLTWVERWSERSTSS
jgi:Kef-type K+ transport system membrane component KefB